MKRLTLSPESTFSILLTALWFGLATGLSEAAITAVRKYYLQRIIEMGVQFPWLMPLAEAIVFVLVGLLLALIGRKLHWMRSVKAYVFVYAFLAVMSLYYLRPRIAWYAALILALGVAIQFSYFVNKKPQLFLRVVRITTGGLAAIVVILGVGINLWMGFAERKSVNMLPTVDSDAPNVLLIVLDTVRAQSMSLYGYDRPTTPNLERLAETSAVFERAISTAPWTLPSHASMFTSQQRYRLNANWYTPLNSQYPTIAEVLAKKGYYTAGFSANMYYVSYEHGLDRGFIHFEDYQVNPTQLIMYSPLLRHLVESPSYMRLFGAQRLRNPKTAEEVSREFLDWVPRKGNRPFFAFLNYFDAHEPYQPPPPYDTMFGDLQRANPRVVPKWEWSAEQTQAEINAYDGSIAYIDAQLGLLIDELEQRDLFENTLVIVTSDHGEQLGEHDLFDHTNSLYIQVLHVPLMIRLPGKVPKNVRIPNTVGLRNLPITIMDLLDLSSNSPFRGESLSQYWLHPNISKEPIGEIVLSGLYPPDEEFQTWYPIIHGEMQSLIDDRYHYIQNGDGIEELFDIRDDPLEYNNLNSSENNKGEISYYHNLLEKILQPDSSNPESN